MGKEPAQSREPKAPVRAGAQGNSLWARPAGAATARLMAPGPRHMCAAPVLFQLQCLHAPEKLRVIIRCDRQSAWKALRQILSVFPLPGPGLAGQAAAEPQSWGCALCGRYWALRCPPHPDWEMLEDRDCLLPGRLQCPEQGVAQNRLPAKIC